MSRMITAALVLLSTLLSVPLASAGEDLKGQVQLAWVDGPTWYAIAGSYHSRREANARASRLGDPWYVANTNICENYTRGLWVVVAGAYNSSEAQRLARRVHGYAKECL